MNKTDNKKKTNLPERWMTLRSQMVSASTDDTNVPKRSMTLRSQTTVVGIVPPNANVKKNKAKTNKAKKNKAKKNNAQHVNEKQALSEFDKLYQEYRISYNMPFLRRKVGFFVKLT
jgi:hypothetical protein